MHDPELDDLCLRAFPQAAGGWPVAGFRFLPLPRAGEFRNRQGSACHHSAPDEADLRPVFRIPRESC